MLTLFFAFLVAPVNPHLSKYISTLKMALYLTINTNKKIHKQTKVVYKLFIFRLT